MGKFSMVSGGARSGKSNFAKSFIGQYNDVGFIATAIVTDAEMRARVDQHKADRPDYWTIYEQPTDMQNVFRETSHQIYIVDSMTVYLANYLYYAGCLEEVTDFEDVKKTGEAFLAHLREIVESARENGADVVFITNENGFGTIPDTLEMRALRDITGRMNSYIAGICNEVYMTISGIPVKIK